MSIRNVMTFYKNVQNNDVLQAKLKNIFEKERAIYTENILTLAKEVGYEFNKAEKEQLALQYLERKEDADELSDANLEEIAGGYNAAHVVKEFIENLTGHKIVIPITKIYK